jgi:hypothetical protein
MKERNGKKKKGKERRVPDFQLKKKENKGKGK